MNTFIFNKNRNIQQYWWKKAKMTHGSFLSDVANKIFNCRSLRIVTEINDSEALMLL